MIPMFYLSCMESELQTACFTGHRSYVDSERDAARLDGAVAAAAAAGYRTFISGMAAGFDLAAAESVVRIRGAGEDVRLVAAVPFAGQPAGFSAADRTRYETLLRQADEVRVLEGRYSHGCYYRRDEWMVERSGRVICWYSGASSGTRYTVRKALAMGREIVNLFELQPSLF